MKYCPSCGKVLEWRHVEQKQRPFCPQCQRIYYDQLKVGAGGLIEQDGRLLLLQRTNDPFRDTGLRVKIERLVDVYFFADDPRGNGILIVYKCSPIGGKLTETLEGVKPTFFAANNIPKNLAGGGHNQAIHAWKERKHTQI
jgi:ADP-ribose pyrophosphatase YjhB (NUDIX family)